MRLRLGPLGAPVAIVLAWVAMRITMLLPVPVADPASVVSLPTKLQPSGAPIARSADDTKPDRIAQSIRAPSDLPRFVTARHVSTSEVVSAPPPPAVEAPLTASNDLSPTTASEFHGLSGTVAGYTAPQRALHRPFTGGGWALINGTGGAVGVPSLGGSQTGVRLFLQGESAPLALIARVSRALGAARDTEVSAGYGLRARGLGLLVERRQRLDVKSGAFVVTGYGGVYDVRLPAGLRFDGFAQGGVAGVRQRRWFADGQARVSAGSALSSNLRLGAGGGTWASAQQGARRLEAGPLVEARVRAGAVGLRVAGEYRFRLTGDATPRSGPALTVGIDF